MARDNQDNQAPKEKDLPKVAHSARDLARMTREARAATLEKEGAPAPADVFPEIIEAHKAYVKAVSKGAEVPSADLDYVEQSLRILRKAYAPAD